MLLGGSTGNATQQMGRGAKTIHTMFGLGTGTQSAQQICQQLSEPFYQVRYKGLLREQSLLSTY